MERVVRFAVNRRRLLSIPPLPTKQKRTCSLPLAAAAAAASLAAVAVENCFFFSFFF
jgi:hypothetical protein